MRIKLLKFIQVTIILSSFAWFFTAEACYHDSCSRDDRISYNRHKNNPDRISYNDRDYHSDDRLDYGRQGSFSDDRISYNRHKNNPDRISYNDRDYHSDDRLDYHYSDGERYDRLSYSK